MTNTNEDTAVDLGNGVLDVNNTGDLYRADPRDATTLKEKIALELTRIEQVSPLDAQYIVHLMQLARLKQIGITIENRLGQTIWAIKQIDPNVRNGFPPESNYVRNDPPLFSDVQSLQVTDDMFGRAEQEIMMGLDPSQALEQAEFDHGK
jgi:hypothetical protein